MLKSALSAFAMLLGLFFAANCPAQGTEELPRSKQLPTSKTHEIWYGVVEGPFQHLRNAFYWNAGTDVKDGIVYSIDDDQVLQLTHVSKTDNALSFDIPDISARFVGTLAEGKLAIGHWKVQGMSLPMKLERVDALPEDRPELILKNLSLNKEGQPEMSFRVYDLKPDGKGMRSDRVFLDVPAAGKRGYLANYKEVDGTITIEALGPKLSLTGSIDSTSERLQGICKIDGKEYTIALSVRKFAPSPPPSLDAKSSNDPSVARDSNLTNDGKKGESVDRKLERDGVFAIEGLSDAPKREWTFRFPDIDKKYPTIILIGGTGTQDRTQTIGDHRPLRWLEEYLLKNRYGVVRLKEPPRDAPKIENSGYASVHDRAVELSKVCQEVAKHPLVDRARSWLLGHSDGASAAFLVAGWEPSVAGVVALAAPGVSGADQLEWEWDRLAELAGHNEIVREANIRLRNELHQLAKSGIRYEDPKALIEEAIGKYRDLVGSEANRQHFDPKKRSQEFVQLFDSKYAQDLLYDPSPSMMTLRKPILALWAELDSQVSADEHFERLVETSKRSGNTDATFAIVPGVNHLFQKASTGAPQEYSSLPSRFDERLLPILSEWFDHHAKSAMP